jgi:hypothetical protein
MVVVVVVDQHAERLLWEDKSIDEQQKVSSIDQSNDFFFHLLIKLYDDDDGCIGKHNL